MSVSLPRVEAGNTWMSNLPLLRFLISSAAPHRLGMVGLRGFIDVGPLELGLGLRQAGSAKAQRQGGTKGKGA